MGIIEQQNKLDKINKKIIQLKKVLRKLNEERNQINLGDNDDNNT